jgi:hypothetical protein
MTPNIVLSGTIQNMEKRSIDNMINIFEGSYLTQYSLHFALIDFNDHSILLTMRSKLRGNIRTEISRGYVLLKHPFSMLLVEVCNW